MENVLSDVTGGSGMQEIEQIDRCGRVNIIDSSKLIKCHYSQTC